MKLLSLAPAFMLATMVVAVPHLNHVEARQQDKTFTITCLGPKCTDYPPTTIRLPTTLPGGGPLPSQPTKGPDPPVTSKKSSTTSSTSKYTPPPENPKTSTSKKASSTSKYTPPPETPTKTIKTTQKATKTETGEVGPSSTRCPVPLYYQCGGYWDGKPWTGCTKCESGAKCVVQNEWYNQCVSNDALD